MVAQCGDRLSELAAGQRDRGKPAPPDPLARYRQLEEIAANGWQISTSELAHLLGLKTLSGSELERYGFRFVKVGKAGIESAWKVEKLERALSLNHQSNADCPKPHN